jgi:hypothetical protein
MKHLLYVIFSQKDLNPEGEKITTTSLEKEKESRAFFQ